MDKDRILLLKSKLDAKLIIAKNTPHHLQKSKNLILLDSIKNIPKLIAYENNILYIEYFEDTISLRELLSIKYSLSIDEFYNIAFKIIDLLEQIHNNGLIHKDINTSNILYNEKKDEIYIVDFDLSSKIKSRIDINSSIEELQGHIGFISPEQTGRINKNIDFRSDYYSLGIVFYKLLTSKIPFYADDFIGVIHQHISKVPEKLEVINTSIPTILSNIVLKLLSKEPGDRYQSLSGLKYDLKKAKKNNNNFNLGLNDYDNELCIKHSHYGRETIITQLENIFKSTIKSRNRLVTISGYSGTGKTSIVYELHKVLSVNFGFYGECKFEQLGNSIPYYGFIKILNKYFSLLLKEEDKRINFAKEKISDILKKNGYLLTSKIKQLEILIGPQTNKNQLSVKEEEIEFNKLFVELIKTISSFEKPLVFFIDDLQWADRGTIDLIKLIVLNDEIKNLLIINAYRDNEVTSVHPYSMMLESINQDTLIKKIKIQNLSKIDVDKLVRDLAYKQDDELLDFIYNISKGNAFFITQLVDIFRNESLFKFNKEKNEFEYDIKSLYQINLNVNIVDIATKNIEVLDKSTIEILKIASAIGSKFTLQVLSLISSCTNLEDELEKAQDKNFIIKVKNKFKFTHDRIEEAFYSLIKESEIKSLHKTIALTFEKDKEDITLFSNIKIEIVNHYNKATDILDEKQLARTINLNYIVAKEAKEVLVYDEAIRYLDIGLAILNKKNKSIYWDYLFLKMVTLYNASKFKEIEPLVNILQTLIDSCEKEIYLAKYVVNTHFMLGTHQKGIDYGVKAMKCLDIDIPSSATKLTVLKEFIKFKYNLKGKSYKSILDFPENKNKKMLLATELLYDLLNPSYMTSNNLYNTYALIASCIAVKYGNSKYSAYCYSTLTLLFGGVYKQFKMAEEIGYMAIKLGERFYDLDSTSRANFIYGDFVLHNTKAVKEYKEYKEYSSKGFIKAGNIVYKNYNEFFTVGQQIIFNSLTLNKIIKEQTSILDLYENSNEDALINFQTYILSFLTKLQNGTVQNIVEKQDEDKYMKNMEEEMNLVLKSTVYTFKALECYLLDDFENGFIFSNKASKDVIHQQGLITDHIFRLVYCLSYLEQKKVTYSQKLKYFFNKYLLRRYAKYSPENFKTYFYLILGQEAAKSNNFKNGNKYFNIALDEAKKSRNLFHIALCYEHMGKFFKINNINIGDIYLEKAYNYYIDYQAYAKAKLIKNKYNLNIESSNTNSILQSSSIINLDLETIVKATQTISQEIKIENILEKMAKIILENIGANRGYIILNKKNIQKVVVYANEQDIEILSNKNIRNEDEISQTILDYVNNNKKIVVFNNEKNSEFLNDEYIQRVQPKSILAIPIIHNKNFKGILYCENTLISDVFSTKTASIASTILTQLIISLENSFMYKDLESLVEERTDELAEYKKALFSKSKAVMLFIEPDTGNIVDCNSSALLFYGYTYNELLSKNIYEINQLSKEEIKQEIEYALKEKREHFYFKHMLKSQKIKDVEVHTGSITLDGKNLLYSIIHDVTEQKIQEKLLFDQTKLASMGEMIGNIAHQWRQPLSVISTSATGLKLQKEFDTLTDKDLIKTCDAINASAQYLSTTIDDFRSFLSKDKILGDIDLEETIHSSLKLIDSKLKNKNISVIENQESIILKALKNELVQVFINIINNAKDAFEVSENKEKYIFIDTLNDKEYAIIRIKDNAGGIAIDIIDKIFEPYFTTKHQSQGTGIGLYMSKQIITNHLNGILSVKNSEYEYNNKKHIGACFEIKIPNNLSELDYLT